MLTPLVVINVFQKKKLKSFLLKGNYGSGGIRTHASEETGALNQRLRPLGHATVCTLLAIFSNYWAAHGTRPVIISVFSRPCRKKGRHQVWYLEAMFSAL